MKVHKKKAIFGIVLGVFFMIFVIKIISNQNVLERDRDKEFAKGTSIRIEEMSDLQADSLYKLCKVWGYTKYRHPMVIDGTLNWDAELFRVMPQILEAESQEKVNEVLFKWLNQFEFTEQTDEKAKVSLEVQEEYGVTEADTDWITDETLLGKDVSEYLLGLSRTYISERENSYASFGSDGRMNFDNESKNVFAPEDDGVKMLALFRFWNIYEYYSPHVSITKTDWEEVLKESIRRMPFADSYEEYVLEIARVAAQTGDAHLTVDDSKDVLKNYYGAYYIQCSLINVDGQMAVRQVTDDEKNLKQGDILVAIDDEKIENRISELSVYKALPDKEKIINQLGRNILQTQDGRANVKVLRNGVELEFEVETSEEPYQFKNPYQNGWLKESKIGYIDPSALEEGDMENLMKTFAKAEGIIVDLRYYPSVYIKDLLAEYINPEPTVFAKISIPNGVIPGSFVEMGVESGNGANGEEKKAPQYSGKVMLLMNEESQSQSEFTIMSLRQAPKATVVGSPSIGADGDWSAVYLPGHVTMTMTGRGIYTPEGGQTQRVGLTPDVEIYPTLQGIQEGRDELIEKAVELIEE